jgi:hypothetical protein
LFGDVHPPEFFEGKRLGLSARRASDPDTGKGAVLESGQVFEKVEVLKHHTGFAADVAYRGVVIGKFDSLNLDQPFVVDLKAIDAADKRRLPGS